MVAELSVLMLGFESLQISWIPISELEVLQLGKVCQSTGTFSAQRKFFV